MGLYMAMLVACIFLFPLAVLFMFATYVGEGTFLLAKDAREHGPILAIRLFFDDVRLAASETAIQWTESNPYPRLEKLESTSLRKGF